MVQCESGIAVVIYEFALYFDRFKGGMSFQGVYDFVKGGYGIFQKVGDVMSVSGWISHGLGGWGCDFRERV